MGISPQELHMDVIRQMIVGCVVLAVVGLQNAAAQECVFVQTQDPIPEEVFDQPAIVLDLVTDGRYTVFAAPPRMPDSSISDWRVMYYDSQGDGALRSLEAPPGEFLQFGCAIEVIDGIAYIGARGESVQGTPAVGFVYVFDLASGDQIGHIAPPSFVSWGFFGTDLWSHGDQLFVRSSSVSTTEQVTGMVYAYDRHTYDYLGEIAPDYLYNGGFYGVNYGVTTDEVAIAEPGRKDSAGWDRGSCFLFEAASRVLLREFQADQRDDRVSFGRSLAVSDEFIAVGCLGMSFRGRYDHGLVQVFDVQSGDFLYELRHPAHITDWFGTHLTIVGEYLVVSNPVTYMLEGGFFVYRISDGQLVQTVLRGDIYTLDLDRFGSGVSFQHGKLFVRTPHFTLPGIPGTAEAYVLRNSLLDLAEPKGAIDENDLAAFISNFVDQNPEADIANPYGHIDFFDIARYTRLYSGECE
jgi:hypothetical protein